MSVGTASAGMIGNAAIMAQAGQTTERQALIDHLQRSEVREQLLAMGVQPEAVESRIHQLSSEELTRLNQQIADAPAGSGIVQLVFLLFVVFVVTDMLGATDVFPFINRLD